MRKKIIGIAIVITYFILSGCGANWVNLVGNGTFSLDLVPSKRVYVSGVNVYQDGEELVVTGKVEGIKGSYCVSQHIIFSKYLQLR